MNNQSQSSPTWFATTSPGKVQSTLHACNDEGPSFLATSNSITSVTSTPGEYTNGYSVGDWEDSSPNYQGVWITDTTSTSDNGINQYSYGNILRDDNGNLTILSKVMETPLYKWQAHAAMGRFSMDDMMEFLLT
jgi:hypothetical protein